jgi:hypothetical protein
VLLYVGVWLLDIHQCALMVLCCLKCTLGGHFVREIEQN